MIVVAIIAIIAAIAIPNLLRARLASNESAAIGAMRTIGSAQATFQASAGQDGDADGTGEYGDLALLSNATPPYIDEVLGGGTKSGYQFLITTTGNTDTDEVIWEATSWPLNHGVSGNRTFYIDESGVLRGSDIGGGSVAGAAANPAEGGNFPPVGS
jgi:type II secretory pathway pseudopilin PulG